MLEVETMEVEPEGHLFAGYGQVGPLLVAGLHTGCWSLVGKLVLTLHQWFWHLVGKLDLYDLYFRWLGAGVLLHKQLQLDLGLMLQSGCYQCICCGFAPRGQC